MFSYTFVYQNPRIPRMHRTQLAHKSQVNTSYTAWMSFKSDGHKCVPMCCNLHRLIMHVTLYPCSRSGLSRRRSSAAAASPPACSEQGGRYDAPSQSSTLGRRVAMCPPPMPRQALRWHSRGQGSIPRLMAVLCMSRHWIKSRVTRT